MPNDNEVARRLAKTLSTLYVDGQRRSPFDGTSDRETLIRRRKTRSKGTSYGKIKYTYLILDTSTNERVVYVGGHQPNPIEVFRLPAATSTVNFIGVNNLGGASFSLDAIVTINGVRKIQHWNGRNKVWEVDRPGGLPSYNWRRHGFWNGIQTIASSGSVGGAYPWNYFETYRVSSLYEGVEASNEYTYTAIASNITDTSISSPAESYIFPGVLKSGVADTYGSAVSGAAARSGQGILYVPYGMSASGSTTVGQLRSWTGSDAGLSDSSFDAYSPFYFSTDEEVVGDPYLSYGPPDTEFFMGWLFSFGYTPIWGVSSPATAELSYPYELNPDLSILWYYIDTYSNPPGAVVPESKMVDVFDTYFTLSWSEDYGTAWATKAFDDGSGEVTVETYDKNFVLQSAKTERFYPPKSRVSIGRFSYHPT